MPKKSTVGLRVSYNATDSSITIAVKDGDQELGSSAFVFDTLPESIRSEIQVYGLSKVLQDRTSDVTDKLDKLDAMDDVYALFEQGTWKKERKAGAPVVSVEVEALANLKGVSIPAIQKARKGYTKEQWATIVDNEAVQAEIIKVKAERDGQEADLDDLL